MEDACEDQSGFLFQDSEDVENTTQQEPSPSTPETPVEEATDDKPPAQPTTGPTISIETPPSTGKDGYESQPIGSPGSQLKWCGSSNFFPPVPDDTPQPVVSDLFKDESLSGNTLEGKDFFDSFTSAGEAGNFVTPPQSLGSIDDSGNVREDSGTSSLQGPGQSLSTLEGDEGLIMSIDLGSDSASQDNLRSPQDGTEQSHQVPQKTPAPPRELFSTLSLEEEDDNNVVGQPDTQSIDLLDQTETGFESAEEGEKEKQSPLETSQDQKTPPAAMTLLEQSKLATGAFDSSITSPTDQKLPLDKNAGVIHNTGPHPLSPQSPPGVALVFSPGEQQLKLDTTSAAGVIHDTSPHQLTPQSPQDRLQQSPVTADSESSRGIFSPTSMSPSSHPFSHSLSLEGEDPFAAALSISESDRRHDAWLPSEATQRALAGRLASLHGTEYVDRKQLTMPGIIADEPQGDPLKDLVYRYMGEAEATQRKALTVNQVTRDLDGLKRLLENGCLRAAVDLTGLMLTNMAQGKGQHGMPSKHSPETLQVWFTRIAVLLKLQQYTLAETECEAFGNMDQPDLYFEYYPDLYPGRKGSMVPFSFRVIHAELPQYTGKHQEALNRLYHVLGVCNKIMNNLESGLSEFGTSIELTPENRKASIELWKSREVRVLYCIGNCLLSIKDFNRAASVYESLCQKDSGSRGNLMSAIGRIFLQLGDLKSAQTLFQRVEELNKEEPTTVDKAKVYMNKGFLSLAENQYSEAHQHFEEALKCQPDHFIAINNIAVCLLYMGRLKEALTRMESMVQSNPEMYLDEALLFNLCTLYELESSKSGYKKQLLLGMVNKHKGDGFNVSCLKMM
ncbi:trafficking protein particle complex subunit 12-like isoform X2 [Amphiura filiformis]